MIQGDFKFPKLLAAYRVLDSGSQFLELGQVAGGLDREVQAEAAQTQVSREARCNRPCFQEMCLSVQAGRTSRGKRDAQAPSGY